MENQNDAKLLPPAAVEEGTRRGKRVQRKKQFSEEFIEEWDEQYEEPKRSRLETKFIDSSVAISTLTQSTDQAHREVDDSSSSDDSPSNDGELYSSSDDESYTGIEIDDVGVGDMKFLGWQQVVNNTIIGRLRKSLDPMNEHMDELEINRIVDNARGDADIAEMREFATRRICSVSLTRQVEIAALEVKRGLNLSKRLSVTEQVSCVQQRLEVYGKTEWKADEVVYIKKALIMAQSRIDRERIERQKELAEETYRLYGTSHKNTTANIGVLQLIQDSSEDEEELALETESVTTPRATIATVTPPAREILFGDIRRYVYQSGPATCPVADFVTEGKAVFLFPPNSSFKNVNEMVASVPPTGLKQIRQPAMTQGRHWRGRIPMDAINDPALDSYSHIDELRSKRKFPPTARRADFVCSTVRTTTPPMLRTTTPPMRSSTATPPMCTSNTTPMLTSTPPIANHNSSDVQEALNDDDKDMH